MKRLTLSGESCVETLAVLILMANADGTIDDKEREGIRAAANVFNLTKELRGRVDSMLTKPLPMDQLLIEGLTPRDRAFAFVAATWMSGVDNAIDASEVALLDGLATAFGFSRDRRQELAQIARDIEPGRRPETRWADELVTLFKSIPARLEEGDGEVEVTFGGF